MSFPDLRAGEIGTWEMLDEHKRKIQDSGPGDRGADRRSVEPVSIGSWRTPWK